jgi:MipA family protein
MPKFQKFTPFSTTVLSGLALWVVPLLATPAASADDLFGGTPPAVEQQPDWRFTLGGGAGFGPDYEGSDDYSFSPVPVASVSYKNLVFIEGPSARVNVLGFLGEDFPVMAGPLIAYNGGRDNKDNKALDKLGDIDGGVDVGGFVGSQLGPVEIGVTFLRELGDDRNGALADFSLGYSQPLGESFVATLGATASWANDDYMQDHFGITAAQAAASGYSKYDGEAGFKSLGLNVGAMYMINEQFSVGGNLGYTRLLDNAADSPIVEKEGSADQYMGSVMAIFQF